MTYFTGQNRPPKKVGVNRHFLASWTSQPMRWLLWVCTSWAGFLLSVRAVSSTQ